MTRLLSQLRSSDKFMDQLCPCCGQPRLRGYLDQLYPSSTSPEYNDNPWRTPQTITYPDSVQVFLQALRRLFS
jgi:hypothetical protein